ncbi:MAG: antitoxin MazE [Thermoanaerobaculia bacterium]|jgi:antitoxin MazE|nr:antitoxin MazE [Thermoanaerobaculia bacterium]
MKARIIRIGNSRGVRIPESLLEQSHLAGAVRIEARKNEIVIRPAPRQGWEEAFRAMAERRDDRLIEGSLPTSFDETEWE